MSARFDLSCLGVGGASWGEKFRQWSGSSPLISASILIQKRFQIDKMERCSPSMHTNLGEHGAHRQSTDASPPMRSLSTRGASVIDNLCILLMFHLPMAAHDQICWQFFPWPSQPYKLSMLAERSSSPREKLKTTPLRFQEQKFPIRLNN